MSLRDSQVFVAEGIDYPSHPPFAPSRKYPESPTDDSQLGEVNYVYDGLRSLFQRAGYDRTHFGSNDWNPLGEFIRPGDTVLIKPNFVKHRYLRTVDLRSLVTHGSLIRAVLDYTVIALKGRGRIIVGDAPLQSADFMALVEESGARKVVEHVSAYSGIPVQLRDFRIAVCNTAAGLPGDRKERDVDHARVRLDANSEHWGVNRANRYRVTHYVPSIMKLHHNETTHEYLVAKQALDADVVINLPKLKCHGKAGITCCLKNQIGINASKDWLPHHCIGSVRFGGDEYLHPSMIKAIQSRLRDLRESTSCHILKKTWQTFLLATKRMERLSLVRKDPFKEGSWYGNDTLWRTILDLNKVLFYADKEGVIQRTAQRKILYVIDAVVIGEGEGPLNPKPKFVGALVLGRNPVAIDACASALIGFDPSRIPSVENSFSVKDLAIVDFEKKDVVAIFEKQTLQPYHDGPQMLRVCAVPPRSWRGHVEYDA